MNNSTKCTFTSFDYRQITKQIPHYFVWHLLFKKVRIVIRGIFLCVSFILPTNNNDPIPSLTAIIVESCCYHTFLVLTMDSVSYKFLFF